MEHNETNHQDKHKNDSSPDATALATAIDAGYISLHRCLAEEVEFTHVYRAIRRHESGEVQEGLPQSLREQAEVESKSNGLVVSYHCAPDGMIFGVVTNPVVNETFVRLAPLDDLEVIANLTA